ncbi:hypothetical protein FRC05_004657 [Tulasnella sp. 425]|nr:hypothetical protein FRC05_004657 [Tulasnella sp. 425]
MQGVQALPFRQTWTGRRFLLDSIKYIVAACTITICAFTFISPHGSQRVYYDPAIAASGLQTAQTGIPAFDSSVLDSRRYVKGPAAGRFRENLRDDVKYITAWNFAGMTNEFMVYINLIFLAYMSHRIPILPPFIPSASHIGHGVPVIQFSDVYDLPRLRDALNWPLLEWSDIKKAKYNDAFDSRASDMEGVDKEVLGCWGAQQAFDKNNRPTPASTPGFLNLEIIYTPVPFFAKLQPKYPPDTHVSFSGLASILQPAGRAEALAAPSAKNHTSFIPRLKDQFHPPDEQLACFDNLYFVGSKDTFEWEERHAPAWNLVGTEARFNPKLDDLASSYLKKVFGRDEIPLYIAVHIRRTDFKNWCRGAAIQDCFAPLSTYGEKVKEVQEELRQEYGPASLRGTVKEVLVSSDEDDPEFWKDVRELGWNYVDHDAMGTVQNHGLCEEMVGDDTMKSPTVSPVKVAIIGSGLAGLSAAYYLCKENQKRLQRGEGALFEVHLFEKAATLGMDSASISVPVKDGKVARVDVPMRSFQEAYYSNLVKLYREIGVVFRPAHFTYSFSTIRTPTKAESTTTTTMERPQLTTTLLYNGRSGLKGVSRPITPSNPGCVRNTLPLLAQLATFVISTFFLLINYLRLLFLSIPHRIWAPSQTERLDEWMRRTTPKSWISPTMEDVWTMPVEEVLDYIYLGLFTPNYVALQGVQDVVARLAAPLDPHHIHLSSTITSITPDPSNPTQASVHFTRSCEGNPVNGEAIHGFSHVIIATQANQAIPILKTYAESITSEPSARPIRNLIRCLSNFEYRKNVVVNHTDSSLSPPNASDRRILNFISSESRSPLTTNSICVPPNFAMATHVVSPSPSAATSTQTIYQTTNPLFPPCPSSILSVAWMERAILTVSSKLALRDLFCDAAETGSDVTKSAPCWSWLGLKQRKRKALGPLQGASIARPNSRADGGTERPQIWACGSYAFEGIPLLEGCVASARLVVQEGIAGGISSRSSQISSQ